MPSVNMTTRDLSHLLHLEKMRISSPRAFLNSAPRDLGALVSVKGAFLRCLGGSCLLQNTEQGRPGGGGGERMGHLPHLLTVALGWSSFPPWGAPWTRPTWPLGRGALTPSSQKGHCFSMATFRAEVWGLMWSTLPLAWPTQELSVDLGRVRPTPAPPAGMWRQGLAG